MDELSHLVDARELTEAEVIGVVEALIDPAGGEEAKAGFLKAWRKRGETVNEIVALVRALLRHAVDPRLRPGDVSGPMMDICGTGGDRLELFNVSTTSMFVLAASGVVVVKHGNRGVTSRSGTADVLEVLGVPVNLRPLEFREAVLKHGLGFMLAPNYHPAFKAIVPVRKRIALEGGATVFNLLGPLLNPVQPPYQMIGLFDQSKLADTASVLLALGRQRAWAVHGWSGEDKLGMDEVSTLGVTDVYEASPAGVRHFSVDARALCDDGGNLEALRGGTPAENARILVSILSGDDRGPKRAMVLANTAAALVIAGKAVDLEAAWDQAAEAIDSGRALMKLKALAAEG